MPDDAVICTGCGCLMKKTVDKEQQFATTFDDGRATTLQKRNNYIQKINNYINDRNKKATKILFIVSLCIMCFALFLFGNTFLRLSVGRISDSYSSYSLFYTYVDQTGCVVSWVFSILALGSSVAELVMSIKQDSEALKIASITIFAATFTMFVIFLNACIVFVF